LHRAPSTGASFKEPYLLDSDENHKDLERLVARWHTMLRLNSAARGWAYDRLSDLARIPRIPGTRRTIKTRRVPRT